MELKDLFKEFVCHIPISNMLATGSASHWMKSSASNHTWDKPIRVFKVELVGVRIEDDTPGYLYAVQGYNVKVQPVINGQNIVMTNNADYLLFSADGGRGVLEFPDGFVTDKIEFSDHSIFVDLPAGYTPGVGGMDGTSQMQITYITEADYQNWIDEKERAKRFG